MMLIPAYTSTRALLEELLAQRILVLDGSMGAFIYARGPQEEDYRGARFRNHPKLLKNCTEALVLTQPELIEEIHRAYLEAGADIIETCTFNATPLALAEFGLQDHVAEINRTAAEIARRAADEFTRRNPDDRASSPAASGRPTRRCTSNRATSRRTAVRYSFDDFVASYTAQIAALVAGGVDLLAVETGNDILVLKACLFAIDKYFAEHNVRLPVIVSGTIYDNGRTLLAQTPEAFYVSVAHFDALASASTAASASICCAVPSRAWRRFRASRSPFIPTPACPTAWAASPATATARRRCSASSPATAGSTSSAAAAARRRSGLPPSAEPLKASPPRKAPELPGWSYYSGNEVLVVRPETNFVMIGERSNITGSLKFTRLIKEGNYETAMQVAREQVAERRQHPRHQHGRRPDRRRGGDDALPQPAGRRAGPGPRARHDRQLQVVGHRGRPEVRAGQGHRQLDQPQGGRGEVPGTGPPRQALRRRRRRHGVRRGGAGGHRRAQGGDLRPRLSAADRGGRLRPDATSSSTRTS